MSLEHYKRYLLQKGTSKKTIPGYINIIKRFSVWLNKEGIEASNLEYHHLTCYIDYLQEKGLKANSISHNLCALHHYCESLKQQQVISINPVSFIKLQASKQRKLHLILSKEQLEQVYQTFNPNATDAISVRDKIIVSLMLYQGLTITDLQQLQVTDLQLKTGIIQVPASKVYAARKLSLLVPQVMLFLEYLESYNKPITQQSGKAIDHLFITIEGKVALGNILQNIIAAIKVNCSFVQHAKQIRASIIVQWLKEHGLRKTQYRAGHKYISATEAYKVYNTDELSQGIEKFHPLS